MVVIERYLEYKKERNTHYHIKSIHAFNNVKLKEKINRFFHDYQIELKDNPISFKYKEFNFSIESFLCKEIVYEHELGIFIKDCWNPNAIKVSNRDPINISIIDNYGHGYNYFLPHQNKEDLIGFYRKIGYCKHDAYTKTIKQIKNSMYEVLKTKEYYYFKLSANYKDLISDYFCFGEYLYDELTDIQVKAEVKENIEELYERVKKQIKSIALGVINDGII